MLYTMLIIIINAFVNIKAYFFIVIYERKVYASRIIYFRFNVMLLQFLYY